MSSRGPQLLGYPRKTLRSAVMANKLICGSFLVVLFLSCLAEAKSIVPSDQQRSNYQKPQSPGGGGQSKGTFDQEFRSCEVEPQHRIGCGAPGISQQECQELDCCYSNNACYFGTVATLHCTKNGQIILVVARDATVPSINLDTVSLLGGSTGTCRPEVNAAFLVYQFTPDQCGTEVTDEEDGLIVYKNKVSSTFEVLSAQRGEITRDTLFEVEFECRYRGVDVSAVFIKPLILPDPISFATYGNLNVELRIGNGQCQGKGCVLDDVVYNSFCGVGDYPVAKVLREYVYVDVRILGRTDPDLHLQLGDCWVTTDENPYSSPRWDLLRSGCPNLEDTDPTKLLPVDSSSVVFPTHHRRFAFKMFTFVNRMASDSSKKANQYADETVQPLRELLYIHCQCSVCVPSAMDNCDYPCYSRKKRDTASAKATYRKDIILTSGPSVVAAV